MSSNMTPVDEGFIQYPVPGIDNDSQGFRDRYAIIRNNLNTAATELTSLITNTAKINTNNNFGGNKIINANLSGSTVEANIAEDGEPINVDTLDIPWPSGSVQIIRVGSSTTPLALNFTGWPEDNRFAKITIIVNSPESGSRTLAWPEGIKKAKLDVLPVLEVNDVIIQFQLPSFDTQSVISAGGTKIFEVFTYDGGVTLFVNYLGLYE